MPNTSKEHRVKFYQEHGALIETCEKLGSVVRPMDPRCRELVKAARAHFGYSPGTASVDIYRPLFRNYKLWKATVATLSS